MNESTRKKWDEALALFPFEKHKELSVALTFMADLVFIDGALYAFSLVQKVAKGEMTKEEMRKILLEFYEKSKNIESTLRGGENNAKS